MASRTVYLNYELNGQPLNAYEVSLASEDGTYAIKEFDTGTMTKASGQSALNTAVGRYEYPFTADDEKIYLVSWKIIANPGDEPIYQVQQAGPFTTNVGRIRASSDFRGTFIQGTSAVLMLKITDFDGTPKNASIITTTIQDTSGSLVESGVPEKAVTGFYVYEWEINTSQAIGNYVITWEYMIDGVERAEVQTVTVATDVNDIDMYSGRPYEIRLGLESYLTCAQSVPIYFEQCKSTMDNRTYRFSFPRWNQTAGVKIYRNQNKLMTDGFTIDYFKGEVVFDGSLTDFDSINADYNFRWFSDEALHLYLENAARTFNSYPPMGNYTLNTVPDRYIPAIQKQAATDALRHLMLCLQFQEPQKVFGGSEKADQVFGNLETIKKNYEEELKTVYEQKKNQPYVGLTRAVIVPEYTLPGGRSRWFRYLFSTNT